MDFSQVGDIEDLRAVPPGEYVCRVAEVREDHSNAGHLRWGLRWEVEEGDWRGRTACWDSLHWSDRGLPRVKYVLQVLGFDLRGEVDLAPGDLNGRRALVTCIQDEREDGLTGIRRLINRVPFAGYKAVLPARAANGRLAAEEVGERPEEGAGGAVEEEGAEEGEDGG